jgi:hypothetical protein
MGMWLIPILSGDIGKAEAVDRVVADAGPDQEVSGALPIMVTLDATGSVGATGFEWWNQDDGQYCFVEECPAVLTVDAGFTEDSQPGDTRTFTLVAFGEGENNIDYDNVVITLAGDPNPPVADAGPDQTVYLPAPVRVQFDGTQSQPGSYKIVSYKWYNQWGTYQGSGQSPAFDVHFGLLDGNEPKPGMTRSFELVVEDSNGATDEDWVKITLAEAKGPVADAGPDQNVYLPAPVRVQFDGSGSRPGSYEIVSYQWYNQWGTFQASGQSPAFDVHFGLLDGNEPKPGMTRSFKLVVTDSKGKKAEDWVKLTLAEKPSVTPYLEYDPAVGATFTGSQIIVSLENFSEVGIDYGVISQDGEERWYIGARTLFDEDHNGNYVGVLCEHGTKWMLPQAQGCVGDAAVATLRADHFEETEGIPAYWRILSEDNGQSAELANLIVPMPMSTGVPSVYTLLNDHR